VLIFLDFESTSVAPMRCTLLEVAAVATDFDLEETGSRFYSLIAPQRPISEIRAECDPVVRDMHDASGLWQELDILGPWIVKPLDEVYLQLVDWLGSQQRDEPLVLAGCGVSHFDHLVLRYHMPSAALQLAYYDIDVSVVRRFAHLVAERPDLDLDFEEKAHRAMPDVEHAIALGRMFRDVFGAFPAHTRA